MTKVNEWGPRTSFTNNGFIPDKNDDYIILSEIPECNLPEWMDKILEKLPGKYSFKMRDFEYQPVLIEPTTRTYVLGVCYVKHVDSDKMNFLISRLNHPILNRLKIGIRFSDNLKLTAPSYSLRTSINDFRRRTTVRNIEKNYRKLDAFIDNPRFVASVVSWYMVGSKDSHARLLVKHPPHETIYVLDPHGKMFDPGVDNSFIESLNAHIQRRPGRKYKHIKFIEHVADQSPFENSCVAVCFLRAFFMLYNIHTNPTSFAMDYANLPIPCIFATFVSRLLQLLQVITTETYETTKREQTKGLRYELFKYKGENTNGSSSFPIGAGLHESTTFTPDNTFIYIRVPISDMFTFFHLPEKPDRQQLEAIEGINAHVPIQLSVTDLKPTCGRHCGVAMIDADSDNYNNHLRLWKAYLQGYKDVILELTYDELTLVDPFTVVGIEHDMNYLTIPHPQEHNKDFWIVYEPEPGTTPNIKPSRVPAGRIESTQVTVSMSKPTLVRIPMHIAFHIIPGIRGRVKQDVIDSSDVVPVQASIRYVESTESWEVENIDDIDQQLIIFKAYMNGFTDILIELRTIVYNVPLGVRTVQLHEIKTSDGIPLSSTSSPLF